MTDTKIPLLSLDQIIDLLSHIHSPEERLYATLDAVFQALTSDDRENGSSTLRLRLSGAITNHTDLEELYENIVVSLLRDCGVALADDEDCSDFLLHCVRDRESLRQYAKNHK